MRFDHGASRPRSGSCKLIPESRMRALRGSQRPSTRRSDPAKQALAVRCRADEIDRGSVGGPSVLRVALSDLRTKDLDLFQKPVQLGREGLFVARLGR